MACNLLKSSCVFDWNAFWIALAITVTYIIIFYIHKKRRIREHGKEKIENSTERK